MVVVVEIEDRTKSKKPFLGGWRNVATSQEYHNARTQTDPRDAKFPNNRKDIGIAKSTQTIDFSSQSSATFCDRATQFSHLPDLQDKFLKPKAITFSRIKEPSRKEEESALKIQKCYRSYRRKMSTRRITRLFRVFDQESNHGEEMRPSQLRNSMEFKMFRLQSPRTKADFDMVHNVLDRWRISETERTNRDLFRSSKLVAQGLILSKEVKFLRAIDLVRTKVKRNSQKRREFEFLKELDKPARWKGSDGRIIYVQTLQVQQVKEYRELYESLVKAEAPSSIETRIDLLLALKRIIKEHSCQVSRDLEYLIDQELDLLSLHVDVQMLDQLRNRLKLAFLRLVQISFHVSEFHAAESSSEIEYGATRICKSCGRLRDVDHFSLDYRQRIKFCDYCMSLHNGNKSTRIFYEPFEKMLRDLRRREVRIRAYTSLVFIVDFKVIYHLVNDIWHGKSGITECNDLDKLQLVRFRRSIEWSPWNSLVLTKKEALVHEAVANLLDIYDSSLVQKFHGKNLQARLYFESITKLQKQCSPLPSTGNHEPELQETYLRDDAPECLQEDFRT